MIAAEAPPEIPADSPQGQISTLTVVTNAVVSSERQPAERKTNLSPKS